RQSCDGEGRCRTVRWQSLHDLHPDETVHEEPFDLYDKQPEVFELTGSNCSTVRLVTRAVGVGEPRWMESQLPRPRSGFLGRLRPHAAAGAGENSGRPPYPVAYGQWWRVLDREFGDPRVEGKVVERRSEAQSNHRTPQREDGIPVVSPGRRQDQSSEPQCDL